MSPTDAQVKAFAALARRAPQEWQEFLSAVRTYTEAARTVCVQAPAAELPAMQGRAQQSMAFLQMFETALVTADRIERKQTR
jgi:hypothetical protein